MNELLLSNTFIGKKIARAINLVAYSLVYLICTFSASAIAKSNKYFSDTIKHECQNIYEVLVAEIAFSRQQPELGLKNYIEVAKRSQNPELLQKATELAISVQATAEATLLSSMWAKVATDDLKAQLIAATIHLTQGSSHAYDYLENSYAISASVTCEHLLEIQNKLSPESKMILANFTTKIVNNDPKSGHINLLLGHGAAMTGDIVLAEKYIDIALINEPSLVHAIQLKAKLIRHIHNSSEKAIQYLEQQVAKYPSPDLQMFLASALLDNEYIAKAKVILKNLSQSNEYSGEATILYSEILLEENDFDSAYNLLIQVADHPKLGDTAKYLLGKIADINDNHELAISWYIEVMDSVYHIHAVNRAANLLAAESQFTKALNILHRSRPISLAEQKSVLLTEIGVLIKIQSLEEADGLISGAVELLPEDTDLLYSQGMVYAMQNRLRDVETCLRKIIKLDASHLEAINSLGVLLTEQGKKLKEAHQLLSRTVAMSPNNPIYLDSLGWLEYKLGNINAALNLLQSAYKISLSPQIAIHLSEVLIAIDDWQNANKILTRAIQANPGTYQLQEALEKVNAYMQRNSLPT